jgi:hypothetical protein
MSELLRKEHRIRQEIYLEHLRHPRISSNGTGSRGASLQGSNGTSVLLLEEAPGTLPDKYIPNRRKKRRLLWITLRFAPLAAGVAVWLWVYLNQFGIHR